MFWLNDECSCVLTIDADCRRLFVWWMVYYWWRFKRQLLLLQSLVMKNKFLSLSIHLSRSLNVPCPFFTVPWMFRFHSFVPFLMLLQSVSFCFCSSVQSFRCSVCSLCLVDCRSSIGWSRPRVNKMIMNMTTTTTIVRVLTIEIKLN